MRHINHYLILATKSPRGALVQEWMCKLIVQILSNRSELYLEHNAAELRKGFAFIIFQAEAVIESLVGTEPCFPVPSDFTVRGEDGWLSLPGSFS